MSNQATEEVTIGGRTFRILFPDLLRPLTPQELADLRESIRVHGVVMPIQVDEQDGVIDGGNRLRISAELGATDILFQVNRGLTVEQKRGLALSLNLDRRHVGPEDQARLRADRTERVAAKRRQGQSTRQIAESEGISEAQVRNDLKAATAQGCAVDPPDGKVKGRDGKERQHQPRQREHFKIDADTQDSDNRPAGKRWAYEAMNCLRRIPDEDAERREAIAIVEEFVNSLKAEQAAEVQQEDCSSPAQAGQTERGLELAYEALNCLRRIPRNDKFRKRGFQIVRNWIHRVENEDPAKSP